MDKDAPKVIAVYGALRSGTTLLRLMLNQNSNLSCPGETDFLFDHLHQTPAGNWAYDMDALQDDRIYRNHCALVGGTPLQTPTLNELVGRMGTKDQTIVLMLHRGLGRALEQIPDLRVVHMIRDPRDVARSSIGMGWAGNCYFGAQHWINTETEWANVAHKFGKDQVQVLRYEDLIEAPETQLSQLCDFMGVSYQDSMLNYDEGSTYSKPDTSLMYQWKRKQTPHEIGLVEGKVGALLTDLGYTPSGHPVVQPGMLEFLMLHIQNRRSVWAKKFKRFGVIDPLLVTLSNRSKINLIGKNAQRRINEKMADIVK